MGCGQRIVTIALAIGGLALLELVRVIRRLPGLGRASELAAAQMTATGQRQHNQTQKQNTSVQYDTPFAIRSQYLRGGGGGRIDRAISVGFTARACAR